MMTIRTFCIFLLFIILLLVAVFAPPTISKIKDGMLFGKVTTQELDKTESPDAASIDIVDKLSLINGYNIGQERLVMVSQGQHIDGQDIVRIVVDEIEILKNNGIFPQITIHDRFQYFDCTMKTYTNMDQPGINAEIWDLTFTTEDKKVVSLWIDVESHLIYQYNIWSKDLLPALNSEEISRAFAAYLGLQWGEKAYKPGVVEYTTGNGRVMYQFAASEGGNSYSIQMVSGNRYSKIIE